jgi:hypothetical protein
MHSDLRPNPVAATRHLARVFPIQKCAILQLPSLWVCFIPEKLEADFLDFIQQLFVGPLKRRAAGILHHRGSVRPQAISDANGARAGPRPHSAGNFRRLPFADWPRRPSYSSICNVAPSPPREESGLTQMCTALGSTASAL